MCNLRHTEHRRRLAPMPLSGEPRNELLKRPVAILVGQQVQWVDRGARAAEECQGAVGPVRQAMVRAEGRRVHRRGLWR